MQDYGFPTSSMPYAHSAAELNQSPTEVLVDKLLNSVQHLTIAVSGVACIFLHGSYDYGRTATDAA
jgi:hypothetical protein